MQLSGQSRENALQRWIDWAPLWLGLGIAIYFLLPEEPQPQWLYALPMLIGLTYRARHHLTLLRIMLAITAAMLGFACSVWQTERVDRPVLAIPVEQAMIEGRIREMVPLGARLRLTLDELTIDGLAAAEVPGAARVSVAVKGQTLAIGERVRMKASLSAPARPVMPGAFDFGRYFYFRQIGAIGYAMPPITVVEARKDEGWQADIAMARLRLSLKSYFLRVLEGEEGKIAAALVTGDQSLVSDKVSADMRVAGLTHILAISGMHMTIVCGFVFYIVRLGLAAIPPVRHRVDVKKVAAAVAILTGSFYLWLADFPISAVRAHVMIVLYLLAILIGREADSLRSLVLAAVVIFLFLPSSLLDPGFQLSFAAVLALILFYRKWQERMQEESWQARPWWLKAVRYPLDVLLTTFVATAATAPIAAYHFHQFVPYGLFANMLAIPLTSFYITPLMLLAMPAALVGLDEPILRAAGWGIGAMVKIAQVSSQMPFSTFHVPPIGLPGMLAMVLGGLMLLPGRKPLQIAGVVMLALGLGSAAFYHPPDLLVAANGKAIALRDGEEWHLLKGTTRQFAVQEWQRALGVTMIDEPPADARCDRSGCLYPLAEYSVAVPSYPHAAYDDCAMADLVLLPGASHPAACAAKLIDGRAIEEEGAFAVEVDGRSLRLESSCDGTGSRAWTRCPMAAK